MNQSKPGFGRLPVGHRATRAPHRARTGLGHTAGIAIAALLDWRGLLFFAALFGGAVLL